ncbi:nicotinamide riboside transporter PnuC [Apibacter adventoris]|uniref:nicotinamide riboside transporter PnuC n=1 Tax=Apibacter adventoris TaxID=1679466 RepID=UPI000CF6200C|nr:nicotinamide riboside transporter PnuC [Apibacter adventoris]PQL95845.1 hypothetical protein C4S76_01400 [Apibacter adventoris]
MISVKSEKIFRIFWYIAAFGLTLYIGISDLQTGKIPFYVTVISMITVILGYICVSVLVSRSPVFSNVLGMSANTGEIYMQILFRNPGMALSSVYYFITHIFGLYLWTRKENLDEEGKVKISHTNKKALIFTLIFCIAGIFFLYNYGDFLFKDKKNMYVFVLNSIAFLLGVAAQFTMIMRQPFSWILWSISNCVWFILNILSHNYIFAIQSVLYEINALVGVYKWYKEARN